MNINILNIYFSLHLYTAPQNDTMHTFCACQETETGCYMTVIQIKRGKFTININIPFYVVFITTAWRVLGLRMEETAPDIEHSCKYTE
jgi:hypothetical protein